MDSVLKKALGMVTPSRSEEEALRSLAGRVLQAVREAARPHGAGAMLAGSITRDSWLPDKREVDVFILFPEETPRESLEKTGLEIGREAVRRLRGRVRVAYAEHPYVHGTVRGYEVDIVPCYAVESAERIKSAVDRTPFHVRYIEGNFPKGGAQEVRLLKQFCKALGVYGADARTEGFSGYLCDLLIIRHGSFRNVVAAASKWKPGQFIDLENHNHDRNKFAGQPLVMIDPVDHNRNVAAALSPANFARFVHACNRFSKRPSLAFFKAPEPEQLSHAALQSLLKKRGTVLISVVFRPPRAVPDVLWPQLRRCAERLQQILHEYGFAVLNRGVWTDEKKYGVMLFEMEVWKLPKIEKRVGPDVLSARNAANFVRHYRNAAIGGPCVEGGKWVVETGRQFREAAAKLEDSLSHGAVVLKAKGIPSRIADAISNGFTVAEGAGVARKVRDRKFGSFLRAFFEKESMA